MRDFKKSTNSLETRRIRKILNEEARLGISPNSESDTEEVDLQKELYPLGHYINNREEMIEQMFSIIKGAKLKKMIPPILKDMPFDELKADCLIHLLGMSKKRIRAILEGKEIHSSSDSETHSDSSTTPSKRSKLELKPFIIKQEGCSDISDNSEEVVLVDPDLDFLNLASNYSAKGETTEEKEKSKRKLKRKELDKKHKRVKTKVVEVSESDEVQQVDSSAESASENETETQAPKEGKNLLEILELEMRARAIRALLKNNDPQEGEGPQKSVESLTQNPENSKGKSKMHLNEDKTKKITPAKNFRKKKLKHDDVIVIAPKVVTIDLTDENDQSGAMNKKEGNREENVPSSSQNNSLDAKSQKVSVKDSLQTNNEGDQSSVSDKTTVVNDKFSKTKEQSISEIAASCSDETLSKSDSLNKPPQPEHDKSSWAQRWLESKEVKKVVSTSKICGNIRKKIKSAKLAKSKTVQDEPQKPSPAPQKEIEGSVGEYELLSKSNTMAVSNVDGVDNDTQASNLSVNQEPPSSEANLTETATADQVQDVSSTRAENVSAGLAQETVPGLQINEEDALSTNIKSGESNDEMLNTITNCEDTDVPSTSDDEVKRNARKGLNKSYDNVENENVCSTMQIDQVILNHDESKILTENKQIEEEHRKLSPENLLANSIEKVNKGAVQKNSNDTDDSTCLLPNKRCSTQDNEYESRSLLTDLGVNSSTTGDGNSNGSECDSNKNDIETNQGHKNNSKIEPNNFENIQKETKSNACETLKNVLSLCSEKSNQELNEPEALEINITDEDRYIEEINEEKQSTNAKDSIIVID